MTKTNAASILASVVFLKMQEFARRQVTEQARLRAQLEAVVAVTTAELAPEGRIVLDAADGVAIVVLGDPKGALRLAERALTAAAAGLPLSAGVNHGAVQPAGSRDDDGMIGDGIAVAASVAEFASPTRLLISRSFRDALADSAPGLETRLAPAGVFTDAGLRTHELFSPDKLAAGRRRRRLLALGAVAVIGFLGAGVAVRISAEGQQKFVDGMRGKFRQAATQGETFLRGLIEKAKFQGWQKRN
jgi:class 3 adenylate cyclase